MKKRIKIDSSILSIIIIFTGVLHLSPKFYATNIFFDDIFDFCGLILILKGSFLRMVARGHKKKNSQKGKDLVVSGPYTLTRNPMYLGSFLIGAGFALIVWPWWFVPIFALLFYLRFNKQMIKEEKILTEAFGEKYVKYCEKVPRIFPSIKTLKNIKAKEIFLLDEAFSTKESRGLIAWPLLAVVLELLQERVVFNAIDLKRMMIVFILSIIVFACGLAISYRKK